MLFVIYSKVLNIRTIYSCLYKYPISFNGLLLNLFPSFHVFNFDYVDEIICLSKKLSYNIYISSYNFKVGLKFNSHLCVYLVILNFLCIVVIQNKQKIFKDEIDNIFLT